MTDRPEPGDRPSISSANEGRRLDRPPGERYAEPSKPPPSPSVRRAITLALAAAAVGTVLMIALAGLLAISSGLLVAAVVIGRFIGLAMRTARGAIGPGRARLIALAISIAGIAIAQIGIWLYARSEGGVLELVDYLGQTFGPLAPLEFAIAGVIAILSAD